MRTIAIQAGGQSRRMGQDKALVPLAGRPLITHVLHRVAGLGDEVLVTTNHPENYGFLRVRLVSDESPEAGALSGLRTALASARGETVMVLACDMPFVSRALLEHLLARAAEADVIVPRRQGEFEPLHAVYARSCLPVIEAALAAGQARMISFFAGVHVLAIEEEEWQRYDPEGRGFFNVNTPEDLTLAQEYLSAQSR